MVQFILTKYRVGKYVSNHVSLPFRFCYIPPCESSYISTQNLEKEIRRKSSKQVQKVQKFTTIQVWRAQLHRVRFAALHIGDHALLVYNGRENGQTC